MKNSSALTCVTLVFLVFIFFVSRCQEVEATVEALDLASCDTLMKYLYRGMKHNPEDAGLLLRWHETLTKRAGVACIVRVLADRKTL